MGIKIKGKGYRRKAQQQQQEGKGESSPAENGGCGDDDIREGSWQAYALDVLNVAKARASSWGRGRASWAMTSQATGQRQLWAFAAPSCLRSFFPAHVVTKHTLHPVSLHL